jgi:hypothetical protein
MSTSKPGAPAPATPKAIRHLIEDHVVSPQRCASEALGWIDELTLIIRDTAKTARTNTSPNPTTHAQQADVALQRIEKLAEIVDHLALNAWSRNDDSIETLRCTYVPRILASVVRDGPQ